MKTNNLLKLLILLFFLPVLMYSQELKFIEDPISDTYTKNDTMYEEFYTYCPTLKYTLKAEGGTQPYDTVLDTITSCTYGLLDTIIATMDTGVSRLRSRILDQNNDSIWKYTLFYNTFFLDSFPMLSTEHDTSILFYQQPRNVSITGPGVYYDTLNTQFYFRPDSAGPGIHKLEIVYVGQKAGNCGGGSGDPFSLTYGVISKDPFEIVFDQFDDSGFYSFCEYEYFSTDYTVTGGVPPYSVNVDWQGATSRIIGPWHVSYSVTDAIGQELTGYFEIEIVGGWIDIMPNIPSYLYTSDNTNYYVDVLTDGGYLWADATLVNDGGTNFPVTVSNSGWNHSFIIIQPSSLPPGIYTLYVNANSMCDYRSETIIFEILNPLQFVNPGAGIISLCEMNTFQLSEDVWGGKAPYTFDIKENGMVLETIHSYDTHFSFNGPYLPPGFYEYDITVTDDLGNTITKEYAVTVYQMPEPINPLPSTMSVYDDPILISDQPGAIVTGDGIENSGGQYYFYPNLLSVGTHTIVLSITDVNGCEYNESFIVTIEAPDPFQLVGLQTEIYYLCDNDTVYMDPMAYGGIKPYSYSWTFDGNSNLYITQVSDSICIFNNDFATVDAGTYQIACEIADANGSTLTKQYKIYVASKTPGQPILPAEVYENDAPIAINTEQFTQLSGNGVTGSNGSYTFDPASVGSGNYTLTFEQVDGFAACFAAVPYNITVLSIEPIVFTDNDTMRLCAGYNHWYYPEVEGGVEPLSFYVLNGGGISKTSSAYPVELYSETSGEYHVQVGVQDNAGQTATKTYVIVVEDVLTFNKDHIPQEMTEDDDPYLLDNSGNFAFSGTGVEQSGQNFYFNPATAVKGENTIFIYSTTQQCYRDTLYITVVEACNLTAEFTVELIDVKTKVYRFTAQENYVNYRWNLPDGTEFTEKTFLHSFSEDISGVVSLFVTDYNQRCAQTNQVLHIFEAPEFLYSIEGSVFECCVPVSCGYTVAFKLINNELVPVDTVAINANGTYKHENLEEGEYTVLAHSCNNEYVDTYYYHSTDIHKAIIITLFGNATSVDIYMQANTSTGIDEHNSQSMVVYPNPMISESIVKTTTENVSEMYVIDALGRIVLTKTPENGHITLNKDELSSGSYTIVARNYNETIAVTTLIVK